MSGGAGNTMGDGVSPAGASSTGTTPADSSGSDRTGDPRGGRDDGQACAEADILDARILVVDDQPGNLELVEGVLRHDGYHEILCLTNGEEVIPALTGFRPDILLLDLRMPHIDGFAVLERLSRRIPRDDYFPIIALTADASLDARRRALALGAKDFLTKPFDLIELLIRVRIQLETRRMFQRVVRGAHTTRAAPDG